MNCSLGFIVQAGKKYGTGHLHRCLKIAALCKKAFLFVDTDLDDTSALESLITFPYAMISGEGRKGLKALIQAQELDALIIDCARPFRQAGDICGAGIPVIVFDNLSLGRKSDVYIKSLPSRHKDSANFTGFWHSPIRESFFNISQEGQGALITMGGSDPQNSALKAAEAFRGSGIPVTLIAGALSSYTSIEPYDGLVIERQVNDLAPFFEKHSLIICGPGMTLLEAQAAGKKIVAISHNIGQFFALRGSKGYAVLMGGAFLRAKTIQKAASEAKPTGLNIPEGFVFEKWCSQTISRIIGRPACCPLCGSRKKTSLARSSKGTVFMCRNCRSPYYYPLEQPQEGFGEENPFKKSSSGQPASQQSPASLRKENIRRLLALKNLSPQVSAKGAHKLLDVPFRSGDFVQAALDSGIAAWALDISNNARLHDLYHVETFDSLERAASFAPYTMITIWDQLALTSKPLEALRHFAQLLASGGVLAFRAPAFEKDAPLKNYFQISDKGGRLLALRLGLKPLKTVPVEDAHGEKYWEIYCARP